MSRRRSREKHHRGHDEKQEESGDIRIEGKRTMPPEETRHFKGTLRGNISVCGVRIEGDFSLKDGVFVFSDCVFSNYTMNLECADVIINNCMFRRSADCDYTINVGKETNIQFVNSTIKQTNRFIKFHHNSSGHVRFRHVHAESKTLEGAFATFNGSNDVLLDDFSYSIDTNCSPPYSLLDSDPNHGIFNIHSVCSFQALNIRIVTPSTTMPFIRTNSDQLIYTTRTSILGPRFMVVTPGSTTNIDLPTINNELPTSITVPVVPPGGSMPVFVTATSNNNFNTISNTQTATIMPNSANMARRDLPMWPWPNRQYTTHSDITFVSHTTVATSVIEVSGNTNIGIVYSNIITNGVNVPIYIHDGSFALLNVVATSFRSRSDELNTANAVMNGVISPANGLSPPFIPPANNVRSPWCRIERITDSVLLEYSAATSYLYLAPLSASDIGVLLQYPAGGIA